MIAFCTALALTAFSSDDMRSTTASSGSGDDIASLQDFRTMFKPAEKWEKVREAFSIHLKDKVSEDGKLRLYMKHSNEAQEPLGYMIKEKFNAVNPVTYMNEDQRAKHKITFDDQGFVNNDGSFLAKEGDTERVPMRGYTGALIFVQGTDNELYAAKKIPHKVQHSSFFSGGVVQNAGMMYLVNGQIRTIAWQSGHYIRVKNSSRKYAIRMVKYLEKTFGIRPETYFVSDRFITYETVEERDIPKDKFKIIRASEFLADDCAEESYKMADFFDPKNAQALQEAIGM